MTIRVCEASHSISIRDVFIHFVIICYQASMFSIFIIWLLTISAAVVFWLVTEEPVVRPAVSHRPDRIHIIFKNHIVYVHQARKGHCFLKYQLCKWTWQPNPYQNLTRCGVVFILCLSIPKVYFFPSHGTSRPFRKLWQTNKPTNQPTYRQTRSQVSFTSIM